MAIKQKEVLVYGLGAIGSFYAFILNRNENVRLTVVARSNYDAVQTNGIQINSENHGQHAFRPFRVLKSPSETQITFDYVVCTSKAINQTDIPAQIAPCVDPERTAIVLIQNGIGNEEPFRDYFPPSTIISCVTWVGATQLAPGIIRHTSSEDMQIGLFVNSRGDTAVDSLRLDGFAELLSGGGTTFQAVPNIQTLRWEKVVWNAAWNSLTTLTLSTTHFWLGSSPGAMPLTRRLMKEIIDVANASGVPLQYELIDRLFEKILAMPPIGSSMRTDYENHRPMEVEVILGYPIRKAKELGIDASTAETLYVLLAAINKRLISE